MSIREVRFLTATEVCAVGDLDGSKPLRIEGYAAVFNVNAQLPKFRERLKPGAFTRAIDQKQDVVCLFNHDSNIVLGRTTPGTLRLFQDAKGLRYECDLPNTEMGRSIHESIRRGDINGCSFAFTIPEGGQEWSEARDEDGSYFIQREISDTNLMDVSPVTYPCYNGTEVYARDCAEAPVELRSAVDAKNEALKNPPVVTPPAEVAAAAEKREEDSFQELISEVDKALALAYPWVDDGSGDYACRPCNGGRFYTCDTFEGYVIAVECSTGKYFKIPYTHDEAKPENQEIVFGDLIPVEQVYVPSDRAAKRNIELRSKFPLLTKRETRDEFDDFDEFDDEFEFGLSGRAYDGPHENHLEPMDHNGDCVEMRCPCQNRFAPTGSGSRSKAGEKATEAEEVLMRSAEADVEKRGGMTRTKRVGDRDLTSKSFAFVGDPDKTETWKLPIHDAGHVRNALARFNQTEGIPADKKAGVLGKIHAAAKKFGIDVAAEKKSAELAAEKAIARRWADVELAKITFDPEALVRYSEDQPRDDHGRFGQGTDAAEHAGNAETHNAAAAAHSSKAEYHTHEAQAHADSAKSAEKKSDVAAATKHDYAEQAHLSAAKAHEHAAVAHAAMKFGLQSGRPYQTASSSARISSKIANKASDIAEHASSKA